MDLYPWIKALHVVFVTSWFAGRFYLPRIFVNLASVEDVATRERLMLMARKLLRFMTLLALVAVVLGMWLLGHGAKTAGRMNAKLALVALLVGYRGWCALLLKRSSLPAGTPARIPGSDGSTRFPRCCSSRSLCWQS